MAGVQVAEWGLFWSAGTQGPAGGTQGMCWGKLGGGAPTVSPALLQGGGLRQPGPGRGGKGQAVGPLQPDVGPESVPLGQWCLSCLVLRKDPESRKLRSLGQARCCPGEGLSLRVRAGALLLGRREMKAQEGSGLAQVGRASAGQKVTRARRAEGKQSSGCWAGALTQRGALGPAPLSQIPGHVVPGRAFWGSQGSTPNQASL